MSILERERKIKADYINDRRLCDDYADYKIISYIYYNCYYNTIAFIIFYFGLFGY